MTQEIKSFFASPLGRLELIFRDNELFSLSVCESEPNCRKDSDHVVKADIIETVFQQLNAYFTQLSIFHDLPLAPCGTAFQKSVWHELTKIPPGETRTYGDIARDLKSSPRAVGNACRKNPIAIIIPCHRVVAANGLGGYAGQTQGRQVDIKRWLLKHEGVSV